MHIFQYLNTDPYHTFKWPHRILLKEYFNQLPLGRFVTFQLQTWHLFYACYFLICRHFIFFATWINYLLSYMSSSHYKGFPGGVTGKESTCQCRRCKRHGFDSWIRNIPWHRKWQPKSILAWKIPWSEEPGRLQTMGLQKFGHDWAHTYTHSFSVCPTINKFGLPWCLSG